MPQDDNRQVRYDMLLAKIRAGKSGGKGVALSTTECSLLLDLLRDNHHEAYAEGVQQGRSHIAHSPARDHAVL